jgi:DMSO reductase anchor subunit
MPPVWTKGGLSVHPAMSATIATTGAGMASGLLVVLGLVSPGDEVPKSAGFGFAAFLLAVGGLVSGLVFSAGAKGAIPGAPPAHLHWLARTRFLLALNLVPTILFALGWIMFGSVDGIWRSAGLISVVLALLTLFAHARVYVAVPTVPAWHNRWVVLNFVVIGLLVGSLWLNGLVHVFARGNPQIALLSVVSLFIAFYVKRGHWREIDRSRARHKLIATGPGEDHGGARPAFYVPPERTRMLRRAVFILMLALPLFLDLVGMGKSPELATSCALGAALAGTAGVAIERWLFFTDAPTADGDAREVDVLA